MPRCGTLHLFLSLLAAAALLASASRKVDEECISDIQESLIDLADSPKAQLRQAFQTIARSQLYGRPLQIQEHLEKRVYDILSAVDQCGAGTPAVPCLLDSTLPPPPGDKKIFIASNLHNVLPPSCHTTSRSFCCQWCHSFLGTSLSLCMRAAAQMQQVSISGRYVHLKP